MKNKRISVDRMGVWVLVSHLLITLAVLTLYGVFAYIGKPVTTIENMLLVIIGYWFGAIGANNIRPSTQIQASEVKVQGNDTSVNGEESGVK